jgi:26S proteasome regulatory subunit N11
MNQSDAPTDKTHPIDTSETVYISSLALLKMLKHARAGVPSEVLGILLGHCKNDFEINVVDVFSMPQTGTVSCFLENLI